MATITDGKGNVHLPDTIEDWEQAATVEARIRHELQVENERLRAALGAVVKWADDLRYFSEEGSKLAPVFQQAKSALERE